MPALSRTGAAGLVAYAAVTALELVGVTVPVDDLAFAGLVLAMPTLAVVLLAARVRDRLQGLVLVALGFSWLGDWAGDLGGLEVKLGCFLAAHAAYVAAFWPWRRRVLRRPGRLVAYGVAVGGPLAWVVPATGSLAPAVVVYGAALGAMAVLASGLGGLAGMGAALFVVSDLTIAVTAFVVPGPVRYSDLAIMSTYLAAQLLIVLGVVTAQPPEAER